MQPRKTVNDFTQNNAAYLCFHVSVCGYSLHQHIITEAISEMFNVFLCSSDKLSQFVFHLVKVMDLFTSLFSTAWIFENKKY